MEKARYSVLLLSVVLCFHPLLARYLLTFLPFINILKNILHLIRVLTFQQNDPHSYLDSLVTDQSGGKHYFHSLEIRVLLSILCWLLGFALFSVFSFPLLDTHLPLLHLCFQLTLTVWQTIWFFLCLQDLCVLHLTLANPGFGNFRLVWCLSGSPHKDCTGNGYIPLIFLITFFTVINTSGILLTSVLPFVYIIHPFENWDLIFFLMLFSVPWICPASSQIKVFAYTAFFPWSPLSLSQCSVTANHPATFGWHIDVCQCQCLCWGFITHLYTVFLLKLIKLKCPPKNVKCQVTFYSVSYTHVYDTCKTVSKLNYNILAQQI